MTRWITSDTHFFHNNIINHCSRPFQNIEEMNVSLVNNWNSIVKPGDIVYHLGDFCFSNKTNIENMVKRLNGYKVLVMGNHDKDRSKNPGWWMERGFDEVYFDPIMFGDFILSHEPIIDLEYGLFNLHGHTHNTMHRAIKGYTTDLYFNVGVDVHNYLPINLDEIIGEDNV